MAQFGIIGRALAGAGAATIPATMEAMKAEIMQERDQRLNQYQTQMQGREFGHQEQMQGQEFGHQEAMQGSAETFQAEQAQKQRDFEQELKQPELALQRTQGALANLSLAQQKLAHSILNEAINSKDPKERASLLSTYNVMVGREPYGAARTYNEQGLPEDVIYSKQTGETFGPKGTNSGGGGAGGATPSIRDPFAAQPPAAGGNTSAPAKAAPSPYPGYPALPPDQAAARGRASPMPASTPSGLEFTDLTTGGGPVVGQAEVAGAKDVIAQMKATNNFSAKPTGYFGSVPPTRAAAISTLQQAIPYAKGQDLADIQQAIATLSSAK